MNRAERRKLAATKQVSMSALEKKRIADDATVKAIRIMEEQQAKREMEVLKTAYNSLLLFSLKYLADEKEEPDMELEKFRQYMVRQFQCLASGHVVLEDIRNALKEEATGLNLSEMRFLE